VLLEASLVGRVLGIRLLTLRATVVLAPADVTATPADVTATPRHVTAPPPADGDAPVRGPMRSLRPTPTPAPAPARVSRTARPRPPDRRLAEAVRRIDEGAAILGEARAAGP
jgi:hypothetical protein